MNAESSEHKISEPNFRVLTPTQIRELSPLAKRLYLRAMVDVRLKDASTADLLAVFNLLKSRENRAKPGTPIKHLDSLIESVVAHVRTEIARLKSTGAKRAGPRTAIKNIVRAVVLRREGEVGLEGRARRIVSTEKYLFKVYDVARKRGKKFR